jgi:hypothetical protein
MHACFSSAALSSQRVAHVRAGALTVVGDARFGGCLGGGQARLLVTTIGDALAEHRLRLCLARLRAIGLRAPCSARRCSARARARRGRRTPFAPCRPSTHEATACRARSAQRSSQVGSGVSLHCSAVALLEGVLARLRTSRSRPRSPMQRTNTPREKAVQRSSHDPSPPTHRSCVQRSSALPRTIWQSSAPPPSAAQRFITSSARRLATVLARGTSPAAALRHALDSLALAASPQLSCAPPSSRHSWYAAEASAPHCSRQAALRARTRRRHTTRTRCVLPRGTGPPSRRWSCRPRRRRRRRRCTPARTSAAWPRSCRRRTLEGSPRALATLELGAAALTARLVHRHRLRGALLATGIAVTGTRTGAFGEGREGRESEEQQVSAERADQTHETSMSRVRGTARVSKLHALGPRPTRAQSRGRTRRACPGECRGRPLIAA